MSDEERHSIAVAGVVADGRGRVLLMRRRDHGNWEPPGGVLRVGERLSDGVRREIEEETRVRVDVGGLSGVYENPDTGVLALVFRCRPDEGAATRTREAADVRWVTGEEAAALLNEDYAQWVRDALAPAGVAVRAHVNTVKGRSSSPRGLQGRR